MYNAEKEEKARQESKQKKLLQTEEAKKAATEKGLYTLYFNGDNNNNHCSFA